MKGRSRPRFCLDERGIALQTIIVMVVLLAIAGAVSAVLLNRAGSETDRLDNETVDFAEHGNKFACDTAGGTWTEIAGDADVVGNKDGDKDDKDEGTCGAQGSGGGTPVAPDYDNLVDEAACQGANPPGVWDGSSCAEPS